MHPQGADPLPQLASDVRPPPEWGVLVFPIRVYAGKDGTDPVYIVKGTLEDARERNLHLHLLLADLEKAFDSVESWSLEESYRWAGLSERTVRLLGALDGRGHARVITPFGLTELHAVLRGVREGEVLSPTKFILWLEPWLRHAHVLYGHFGHALREGARISHQAMADDVALVSGSGLGMTTLAASFGRFLVFHGVTISGSKSVYGSSPGRSDSPTHLQALIHPYLC